MSKKTKIHSGYRYPGRRRGRRNAGRGRLRRAVPPVVLLVLFLAGAGYLIGFPGNFLSWKLPPPGEEGVFAASEVPAYSGRPDAEINGDVPFFSRGDLTAETFETYGELDGLGRCTAAYACVGPETMPEEEREDVRSVYPSGWKNARYEWIDREYLYNRCHLIGYQLTGENANERNLITGTRYMNVEGMLPYENAVAQYIRETGHHVLYRVTPDFRGSNLLASGVLMEARSVEDPEVQFCVYCYNVQPGVLIDYATGENRAA